MVTGPKKTAAGKGSSVFSKSVSKPVFYAAMTLLGLVVAALSYFVLTPPVDPSLTLTAADGLRPGHTFQQMRNR